MRMDEEKLTKDHMIATLAAGFSVGVVIFYFAAAVASVAGAMVFASSLPMAVKILLLMEPMATIPLLSLALTTFREARQEIKEVRGLLDELSAYCNS